MPSVELRFACTACGRESLRWEGRCPGCGEWNSLVEVRRDRGSEGTRRSAGRAGRGRSAPAPLSAAAAGAPRRIETGLGDLDLVLGGGLVAGSLVLLGGSPGVGKSTLLLQVAARIRSDGETVLYASGEESAEQVRLRAARLGGGAEEVPFLGEPEVEEVLAAAAELSPALLCVDSIQTLRTPQLASAPGTVSQVRECAGSLQAWAKRTGTAVLLVGHVTKGGGLAGPRTLEHLVDAVLRFESPGGAPHRVLRATKNRFGSVGELAVFRMESGGLVPVVDPGTAFLAGRRAGAVGSAVAVPLVGTRPLLAEVQALSAPSPLASPRRTTTGFPARRLAMLLAVLERRAGLSFAGMDVFLNVAGGLRLDDPGTDLAAAAALASARLDRAVPEDAVWLGEVGLGGEVRGVAETERRLREAARGGLDAAVVARAGPEAGDGGLRVRRLEEVGEAVAWLPAAGAG